MNFQHLHELLRLELLRRIDQGILTGTKLAQQAGFQQAHISNFLNKKRSLSLEGLDRVLEAQDLTIGHLLPLNLNAGAQPAEGDAMEGVPVVSAYEAMDSAFVQPASIIETVQVSASRLHGNRTRPVARQAHWQRFLAVRTDVEQAAAMAPMLLDETIAVIDRHYNSLAPYRSHQQTLFAIRCRGALLLRFVEVQDGRMILRPCARAFPIQLLKIAEGMTPADYIVGRVCILLSEL